MLLCIHVKLKRMHFLYTVDISYDTRMIVLLLSAKSGQYNVRGILTRFILIYDELPRFLFLKKIN